MLFEAPPRRCLRPTLSPVKHGSSEHLVPDLVGIPRILTDDESPIMLFDQPTSWRSTETSRISDSTVRSGQFDKDGPQDSDSPGRSRDFVFWVFVHRAGDVTGHDCWSAGRSTRPVREERREGVDVMWIEGGR